MWVQFLACTQKSYTLVRKLYIYKTLQLHVRLPIFTSILKTFCQNISCKNLENFIGQN